MRASSGKATVPGCVRGREGGARAIATAQVAAWGVITQWCQLSRIESYSCGFVLQRLLLRYVPQLLLQRSMSTQASAKVGSCLCLGSIGYAQYQHAGSWEKLRLKKSENFTLEVSSAGSSSVAKDGKPD